MNELTSPIGKVRVRELVMIETKTVAELLIDLNLSKDHVVLVEGERQELDDILHENESVVILPIIAGG